jgi:hypothetical protein
MASFSIWHWAIILLIIGVPVIGLVTSKRTIGVADGPSGFGGWLMLLAIGQLLAPLRTLAGTMKSMDTYAQLNSVAGGHLVANGEMALNLASMGLQVAVVWLMFKKSRLFPRLFFYQWLSIPVVLVVDILLVSVVLKIGINELLTDTVVAPSLGAFLGTGLWMLYLSKSVRVRNTFIR